MNQWELEATSRNARQAREMLAFCPCLSSFDKQRNKSYKILQFRIVFITDQF